jgi:hypothetical protein
VCFSGPPDDNSAEIARREEEARQSKIAEGRKAIDTNFAAFTPDYYDNVSKSYQEYYLPQLEDQMKNARREMVFNLSRSGNLNASADARSMADLRAAYLKNRALIGDRALAEGKRAEADVASNRNELYSQLSASADPSAAANTAAARAASLTALPTYSPLADIFSSFVNQGANQVAGARGGFDNLASAVGFKPAKGAVSYIS